MATSGRPRGLDMEMACGFTFTFSDRNQRIWGGERDLFACLILFWNVETTYPPRSSYWRYAQLESGGAITIF